MKNSVVFIYARRGALTLVDALKEEGVWGEYKHECAIYHHLSDESDGTILAYLMKSSYLAYYVVLRNMAKFGNDILDAGMVECLGCLLIRKFNMYSVSFDWSFARGLTSYWSQVSFKLNKRIPSDISKKLSKIDSGGSLVTSMVIDMQEELNCYTNVTLKR